MNDLRTAAQQALEFIRAMNSHGWLLADYESDMERTVAGLEAALAQEQADKFCDSHCTWADHATGCVRAELAQEQAEPVQEPVALVRTWHKGEEQHAELLDWGIGVDALPDGEHTLYTAPPKLVPLTEEEIDAATASSRDALLDHIYEYGTAAEGVLERIRKLCRAVERALEEKSRGR